MQNNIKIEILQILRAIAAMLVVLFHINGLLQTRVGNSQVFNIFKSGTVGVDLFFVLSGFIIYYSSYNKIESAKEFLLRRFIRIFPIYWVATITTLALFFISKHISSIPSQAGYLGNTIENGGLKMIIMSFLLIPNQTPILVVSWTLSFEVFFYILFGLLFFRKPSLFIASFIAWVIVCYLNLFIFHIDYNPGNSHPLNAYLNPIILEFLLGCVVAILILRGFTRYPKVALLVGLIWFVGAALTYKSHREVMLGVPAALILYGSILFEIKFPAILKFIGDASYSIYLFHFPMLGALMKLWVIFKVPRYVNSTMTGLILFGILIFICCMIYQYIEKPLLKFFRKRVTLRINHGKSNLLFMPNGS